MNAEEIRKVNTAGSYPWDDERLLSDQISTLSGLMKELTAQVAELNAKTPSLRMQVSMAAMQAELSSPSDFPINIAAAAKFSFEVADALIAVEKGGE